MRQGDGMRDEVSVPVRALFVPFWGSAVAGALRSGALAPLAFAPIREQRQSNRIMEWAFRHAPAGGIGAARAVDVPGGPGPDSAVDESELSG